MEAWIIASSGFEESIVFSPDPDPGQEIGFGTNPEPQPEN